MAQRTLLLDLDGTLWDSRPWYAEVLAHMSGRNSIDYEAELAAGMSVVQLAIQNGITRDRFAREARYRATRLAFYDRAHETLNTLRERGTSTGVVTNLPGWLVTPVIEATGIEEYFDAVVTPRPGVPAKPKPHGIRKALMKIGRGGDSCTWFVGDGVVDAKAAAKAGVRFAWAAYGYESLAPPDTEIVLYAFEDILKL